MNLISKFIYRISSYSFRTFMHCDLWPYVLWPLDFRIQKRIVSAETIWDNTVFFAKILVLSSKSYFRDLAFPNFLSHKIQQIHELQEFKFLRTNYQYQTKKIYNFAGDFWAHFKMIFFGKLFFLFQRILFNFKFAF